MSDIRKLIILVPSLQGGGAERVLVTLANHFSAEDKEVQIYLLEKNVVSYEVQPQVRLIWNGRWDGKPGPVRPIGKICLLRRLFRENADACVLSFYVNISFYAALAGLGTSTRLVFSIRQATPWSLGRSRIKRQIFRQVHRMADTVVFQTPEQAAFFPKAVQKRSCIILNPLRDDLPDCFTGETRKEFIYFGRLTVVKNAAMVIRAFGRIYEGHPDFRLRIVGKGPERDNLQRQINKAGLSQAVLIENFRKDILTVAGQCCAYVSASRREGLSNAMLEALAVGLPCICTDCAGGGARLMIRDGENGFLLPLEDEEAMAAAMEQLITVPGLREKMSREAYGIREILSGDRYWAQWDAVLFP